MSNSKSKSVGKVELIAREVFKKGFDKIFIEIYKKRSCIFYAISVVNLKKTYCPVFCLVTDSLEEALQSALDWLKEQKQRSKNDKNKTKRIK